MADDAEALRDAAEAAAALPDDAESSTESGSWRDATAELRAACAALDAGGMAMRDGFTLHESMNALELMSPKMDAGMHARQFRSVQERYDAGDLSIPVASASELASVAQQLLARETAWHNGHMLATSVHACVHLTPEALDIVSRKAAPLLARQIPEAEIARVEEELEDDVPLRHVPLALLHRADFSATDAVLSSSDSDEALLAAVSLALLEAALRTCFVVRQIVRKADMYMEEDWSPSLLGLAYGRDVPHPRAVRLLAVADALLARAADENHNGASPRPALSTESCQALRDAIALRAALLDALALMLEPNAEGLPAAEARWQQLTTLARTAGPAAAPPSTPEQQQQQQQHFDTQLHWRALAAAPPRAPANTDPAVAQASLDAMVLGMQQVCALRQLGSLMDLYAALHALSEREPDVVVRSAALLVVYCENDRALARIPFDELVLDDMRAFGIPRFMCETEAARTFASAASRPLYDVLKLLLANRARQRRDLANAFPTWASLMLDAESVDQHAHADAFPAGPDLGEMAPEELREHFFFFICAWTTQWTARLMLHHMNLGLELELHGPREVAPVFWYMQYLLTRAVDSKRAMVEFLDKLEARLAAESKPARGSGGAGKKSARLAAARLSALRQDAQHSASNVLLGKEQLLWDTQRLCADGIVRFVVALQRAGRVELPALEFGSEEMRYDHRFAAYAQLHAPRYMPYAAFAQVMQSDLGPEALLENAAQFFSKAKHVLGAAAKSPSLSDAEREHVRGMLKVAVANTVSVMREQQRSGTKHDAGDESHVTPPGKLALAHPGADPGRCYLPVLSVSEQV